MSRAAAEADEDDGVWPWVWACCGGGGGGGSINDSGMGPVSMAISAEYSELPDELWTLLSRFILALRLKRLLPKMCTLSGRSRGCIMLLAVDLPDDFLDSVRPSSACSHDGRSAEASDRSDEEPDEVVWWLLCLSRIDARIICFLSARMLSGDGGPSMAGSSRSVMLPPG